MADKSVVSQMKVGSSMAQHRKKMTSPLSNDLEHFVAAQDPVFDRVRAEVRRRSKATHWMWFVFPQLRGLGRSATADRFGLASVAEARSFWAHPVLGPRLKECVELILTLEDRSAAQMFGSPDNLKLRSSLTLFERAVPDVDLFARALEKYFDGERDPITLAALG